MAKIGSENRSGVVCRDTLARCLQHESDHIIGVVMQVHVTGAPRVAPPTQECCRRLFRQLACVTLTC